MAQGVAWIGGAGNFNDPANWSSDSETSAPALVSLEGSGTAAAIQGSAASGRFWRRNIDGRRGASLT
jgi:hypothetical protein